MPQYPEDGRADECRLGRIGSALAGFLLGAASWGAGCAIGQAFSWIASPRSPVWSLAVAPALFVASALIAYLAASILWPLRPRSEWVFGMAVPLALAGSLLVGIEVAVFESDVPLLFVLLFWLFRDTSSRN